MAVKVRPLHDRIIVERIEEGEQQVGGIIIPDTAKEKPQQGKIIAAGNGKVKDDGSVTPLDVKAGDTVLFGKPIRQHFRIVHTGGADQYWLSNVVEPCHLFNNGSDLVFL